MAHAARGVARQAAAATGDGGLCDFGDGDGRRSVVVFCFESTFFLRPAAAAAAAAAVASLALPRFVTPPPFAAD